MSAMDLLDFVVIGAGPAGEAAVHRARSMGASVAIADREWFGGSCPHVGCVPSKSLLHAADRHASGAAETIHAFPSTSRILDGLFAEALSTLGAPAA
jgi:dihydrolipoamide dehydrogenase